MVRFWKGSGNAAFKCFEAGAQFVNLFLQCFSLPFHFPLFFMGELVPIKQGFDFVCYIVFDFKFQLAELVVNLIKPLVYPLFLLLK